MFRHKPTDECKSREWCIGGFWSWLSTNRHNDVTISEPVDNSSEFQCLFQKKYSRMMSSEYTLPFQHLIFKSKMFIHQLCSNSSAKPNQLSRSHLCRTRSSAGGRPTRWGSPTRPDTSPTRWTIAPCTNCRKRHWQYRAVHKSQNLKKKKNLKNKKAGLVLWSCKKLFAEIVTAQIGFRNRKPNQKWTPLIN